MLTNHAREYELAEQEVIKARNAFEEIEEKYEDFLPESKIEARAARTEIRLAFVEVEQAEERALSARLRDEWVGTYLPEATDELPDALCADCGEEFTPQGKTEKYCSTKCRVAANRAGAQS